jgi:hypothetical protein
VGAAVDLYGSDDCVESSQVSSAGTTRAMPLCLIRPLAIMGLIGLLPRVSPIRGSHVSGMKSSKQPVVRLGHRGGYVRSNRPRQRIRP